jgi:hypothetical protein
MSKAVLLVKCKELNISVSASKSKSKLIQLINEKLKNDACEEEEELEGEYCTICNIWCGDDYYELPNGENGCYSCEKKILKSKKMYKT